MDVKALTFATVTTVAELLDLAESYAVVGSTGAARRWAFRGQSREYQTLVPSFQRVFSGQHYAAAELIEHELIAAFREHYAVLKDRSADMPAPEAVAPGYDLRCLSVMQHYEVPTRLLDWTMDIWTAVYFACASDADSNSEVWMYDRAIFNDQVVARPDLASLLLAGDQPPFEPPFLAQRSEHLIAELDPQITPRMKQQHAHHTVSANVFGDHAPLLDDLRAAKTTSAEEPYHFGRFVIASSCKGKALRFLADHAGITASTIFPDVVGLGRFLRWQLDSLRTMLL